MNKIKNLEEILVSKQQISALEDYQIQALEFDRSISGEDFVIFYNMWCYENNCWNDLSSWKKNDLNKV